jgi:Mg2+-importing ATPase
MEGLIKYWSVSADDLIKQVRSTTDGLTNEEAKHRLDTYGPNLISPKKSYNFSRLLWAQFKNPIILILVFAAVVSFFLHDTSTSIIVLSIILISGLLGFWQEYKAMNAVQKLTSLVLVKATLSRGGSLQETLVEEVVPGDIVILKAGDLLPGDSLILESKDLFVNEAALTGETFPVEKSAGVLDAAVALNQRTNTLFLGTHIVSGSGKAVVVHTGLSTEFGKVARELVLRPPATEFEVGVRKFGYLLLEVTLTLVITIFAINVFFNRPILDSFLFSLALAVGLTPQLLPAIISVNLARGASHMASSKVIVKRLSSIENFGSMNVLCLDKTGTLTEGKVQLHSALDIEGHENEKVRLHAYINASYETGYANPIDDAIRSQRQFDITKYKKLDEIPYDFVRKRISVLISRDNSQLMITKGALPNILAICSSGESPGGEIIKLDLIRPQIEQHFEKLSEQGFRTLGIAYRLFESVASINNDSETDMTFLGILVFFDPPKEGIIETLADLKQLGISLKVITGDNKLVATSICSQVKISTEGVLTGSELHETSNEAMLHQVNVTNVFAEVEPNQKEQIILALRKTGNVVGFLGDGINDASALHAADVGISVDSGVAVAKEAADIVLMAKDLKVLVQGVQEGRRTFANTIKYVFMAASANFGNMFSVAGISLLLPFLPLLPKQILLTNLLTDFPEMTIATDTVDKEFVQKPRRWDIKFIRNFMITFGILSSLFDFLTFSLLLLVFHADMDLFRTGWFVESVVSAALIVLIIRSRRSFLKSRPSSYLIITTLCVAVATVIIPFTPLGKIFGFVPLPPIFLLLVMMIIAVYMMLAEITKKIFYSHVAF